LADASVNGWSWTDVAPCDLARVAEQREGARRALAVMGERVRDAELNLPRPGKVYVPGAPNDDQSERVRERYCTWMLPAVSVPLAL
jgi:hypothetical protein